MMRRTPLRSVGGPVTSSRMKRTLHLLVFLFLICHARADLLIQRVTQTTHYTGNGAERTLVVHGFYINDIDGPNGAAVLTANINGHKIYQVGHEGDAGSTPLQRLQLTGARGRAYTVLTTGTTDTNDTQVLKIAGILLRGADNTIPIRDGRTLDYPRVFRGTKFSTELIDGAYQLTEETGTRVFLQSETLAVNNNGENADAVVQRISKRLEAAGYVLLR